MKRFLCCMFLLCSLSLLAQQPAAPPPPGGQQPSPPAERQLPDRPMPPDINATDALSTEQVSAAIDDKLGGDPALKGSSVKATVTDRQVVLTGTVENERQHEIALRIVGSYSGDREIVDNIETLSKL